ncbi:hypothetical protein GXM_02508 [Nostoc sphaeroides CCNUC1]|uniref:Uncharacterized protein n=1 Tax=Nostoc sphaeroides CCNUC1 TaxID=2653204 RepID=A0A5P8VX71_9NOSO|nr:hypothetical protein GXM_02508 [Nostoc sphaeroides CCNUC1]
MGGKCDRLIQSPHLQAVPEILGFVPQPNLHNCSLITFNQFTALVSNK